MISAPNISTICPLLHNYNCPLWYYPPCLMNNSKPTCCSAIYNFASRFPIFTNFSFFFLFRHFQGGKGLIIYFRFELPQEFNKFVHFISPDINFQKTQSVGFKYNYISLFYICQACLFGRQIVNED